ncbi:hypothetical protein LAZ67_10004142 [Cordylochernes scorpioides]|uniref:Uncharacterized protein n=1 Tax=Cordylochernes scorpioides TaxID=51811 RepID=A0ABY6KY61_9ARAC|nr:hypothetical protein LAZ67_10004142 [Cordylochernes scorpioides]
MLDDNVEEFVEKNFVFRQLSTNALSQEKLTKYAFRMLAVPQRPTFLSFGHPKKSRNGRFSDGRYTLEEDKHTGRPSSSKTPESIEKVREFVANNRSASLRMMAEVLHINKETIRTILHEDLGIIHKEFVPAGQTITGEYYLNVLKRLIARIRRIRPEYRDEDSWCLLHDNAPSHSSLIVRRFLAKNNVCVLNHPPYSPDLAPAYAQRGHHGGYIDDGGYGGGYGYEDEHPYKFGYDVKDEYDAEQHREEESDGKNVRGSYGFRDPHDGRYRHVDYVADEHGFRAQVRTNEPGTANQNPADVHLQVEQQHGGRYFYLDKSIEILRAKKHHHAPQPYKFGYDVKDEYGATNFRDEEGDGHGAVKGSYGYRDPEYGLYRIVEYVADHDGFRAQVKTNEPGTQSQDPAHVRFNAEPYTGRHHCEYTCTVT